MRGNIPVTALVVGFLMLSVSTVPAQNVEVSREGNWRIWYTSPDLRAELDYHWADLHPGDEWLLLKLAVAGGPAGGVTPVNRKNVMVQTPGGAIVGLPSQAEFRAVSGSMEIAFQQEDSWGPSASRFRSSYVRIMEWFFSPPGYTFHREFIAPSARQYFTGPLVFRIPGGVQPGEWTLIFELEGMRAEIPFVLGGKN